MDFYDIQGLGDSSDSDSSSSNESTDSNASSNLNESADNAATDVELNQQTNELNFSQKVCFQKHLTFSYSFNYLISFISSYSSSKERRIVHSIQEWIDVYI